MNLTELLADDHREVTDLLSRVERGELDPESDAVDTIVRELSVHAAAEEIAVYPIAAQISGHGTLIEQLLQEHQLVKDLLVAIERGSREERTALLAALAVYVRAHVAHEETKLFAELDRHATPDMLERIAESFAHAKETAPTHPHPHAPRTPPANVPAGMAAALLDRVRDAMAHR